MGGSRFWPDARGWIGVGTFVLTVLILILFWQDRELRGNEFFKNLAILIVGTGWVNGAVSWAYSATKTGGELATQAASRALAPGSTVVNTGDETTVDVHPANPKASASDMQDDATALGRLRHPG